MEDIVFLQRHAGDIVPVPARADKLRAAGRYTDGQAGQIAEIHDLVKKYIAIVNQQFPIHTASIAQMNIC